ncbi:dihydrolipoamide acetyltransferase family protein [Maledivibacter halophilus]|uniref:Dihydrolipoamide acetyltransferase component of pyruvate dehydrogenase complex n=1 Tax=Maledivibacter halophilus TaxID=36842 RepID=A0A1T5KNX5_9FIRM|nr:dihydrolipoamide acetyltransferase family protein [Maledivibacter halophilus]SKC65363.1 pyruvate dehydrogenase E2 component (dihydrolipoamide acetyltransferase) [Maledivibacter halophilus]
MAEIVVMPKLGLTMKEGKIVKWCKSEGDKINEGETLLEVATDKLTNDIEAIKGGVVRKLLAQEGDVVPCLEPIAIIGDSDEDISSLLLNSREDSDKEKADKVSNDKEKAKEKDEKSSKSERIKISPVAKKLAKENGVDITKVVGTGPQGRIVKGDIEKYIENKDKVKASPMAEKYAEKLNVKLSDINKDGRIMKSDVLSFDRNLKLIEAASPREERVPMDEMRKVIAQRMSQSWERSPSVTYDIKVDITNLRRLKNELKEIHKVTYTDLLVKILSKALLEFPLLNCSIDDEEIVYRNYTNIGIAVALENGLIVPVVKYANVKGLKEISSEIKELAFKARNNELSTEDLTGGTFTITNLGMYGIASFSPIINQPEVAILGVNTIEETPVLENGNIINKPFMKLSLTADHRAVDGAVAAQFLYKVKQYVEKPEILML